MHKFNMCLSLALDISQHTNLCMVCIFVFSSLNQFQPESIPWPWLIKAGKSAGFEDVMRCCATNSSQESMGQGTLGLQ